MAKMMYFGTREYMTWIPCPRIDYDASRAGWSTSDQYLNGGAYVRRSFSGAKRYNLSWALSAQADLRPISDFAEGIYGEGPIYFIDPFAQDSNLLPQYWGAPVMGARDGIVLSGTELTRPTLVSTPANTYGYPTSSAVYMLGSNQDRAEVYIPIPIGYQLWLGVHGSSTGAAAVSVQPYSNNVASGSPVALSMLSVTTNQRVNASYSGATYSGVVLKITGTSGTLTLSGIMAQLIPVGTTPPTGGYISGQGNGGCSFEKLPTLNNYSAALDKVGMSAVLVETQPWV